MVNSGVQCDFCGSFNTYFYHSPFHIKNTILCGYCHTIANLSFKKNILFNEIDEIYLTYLNNFITNVVKNNPNYKDILVFDPFLSNKDINIDIENVNINFINDFELKLTFNSYLKYAGRIKFAVIPNLNLINFKEFYFKIKDFLDENFTLTLGIFRNGYYVGKTNRDYHWVYNPLSIERILEKTDDFVQEDFFYQDKFYLINIGRHEPTRSKIAPLEKLTNNNISEDSHQNNIRSAILNNL